jgi:hypothetical protein
VSDFLYCPKLFMNSTNFQQKILDYFILTISSRSFPHCEYRLWIVIDIDIHTVYWAEGHICTFISVITGPVHIYLELSFVLVVIDFCSNLEKEEFLHINLP